MPRHARVLIDLDAISHNVRELRALTGGVDMCAVVKADGYGHGSVPVARAALEAGARSLGVALVEEGEVLRSAGIEAPILVLSEPSPDQFPDAFTLGLTPTLYHRESVALADRAARSRGGSSARWAVHLKIDTGMHRVGASPAQAKDLAAEVHASGRLILDGVYTHLAVADEPERPETGQQLALFEEVIDSLRRAGIDLGTVHAANSAGAIAHPAARLDLVRCGIAIYGIAPSAALASMVDLRPAMSLVTEVSHTATVAAGEGVSYGLRHHFTEETDVAVLPVGYADGIPRDLGLCGGEVLIGGRPRPIRGVVTMDQTVVELGPTGSAGGGGVNRGDEVVLIGSRSGGAGTREVSADRWADLTGTIAYEIVCGISARMPRVHVRGGTPIGPGGSASGVRR